MKKKKHLQILQNIILKQTASRSQGVGVEPAVNTVRFLRQKRRSGSIGGIFYEIQ